MVEERRAYFRVDIEESLSAVARLVSINGSQVPVQKLMEIYIRDLSAGGMKILTALDLPIKLGILMRISFDFENLHFDVKGLLLRKKMLTDNTKEYGIKFIEIPPFEEHLLVRCINQYNIKRVKLKKNQDELRKQKEIKPLVKIMEALDVPAYLVSAQRIVVAANHLAAEMGSPVGEWCYKAICQSNKICAYCQIDEAQRKEDILSAEVIVRNERQSVHWIYLDQGLTLHYLKKKGRGIGAR